MSYCRFSSDGFKSDVYVYESVHECWTIHVAGQKKVGVENLPPFAYYREWHEQYDKLEEWVPLEGPHAGATYHLETPGACADKLMEIRESGLHVPDGVIESLREEQEELDKASET